jgi:hypothetical protein
VDSPPRKRSPPEVFLIAKTIEEELEDAWGGDMSWLALMCVPEK